MDTLRMIREVLEAPEDYVALSGGKQKERNLSFTAVDQFAQKRRILDANPHCG
jgi:hypothetical protein